MIRTHSPPDDGGFDLGEPFARRAALLTRYDDARKELHAAQVDGDTHAADAAGWAVTEALADVQSHQHHLGNTLVMMLRDAIRTCPESLSDVLSEVPAVAEIAEAVAALEVREGVTA